MSYKCDLVLLLIGSKSCSKGLKENALIVRNNKTAGISCNKKCKEERKREDYGNGINVAFCAKCHKDGYRFLPRCVRRHRQRDTNTVPVRGTPGSCALLSILTWATAIVGRITRNDLNWSSNLGLLVTNWVWPTLYGTSFSWFLSI